MVVFETESFRQDHDLYLMQERMGEKNIPKPIQDGYYKFLFGTACDTNWYHSLEEIDMDIIREKYPLYFPQFGTVYADMVSVVSGIPTRLRDHNTEYDEKIREYMMKYGNIPQAIQEYSIMMAGNLDEYGNFKVPENQRGENNILRFRSRDNLTPEEIAESKYVSDHFKKENGIIIREATKSIPEEQPVSFINLLDI